ncbi:hypothetical protein AB6N23_15095, partial [Cellulomonas sp. 179-A 9B4 NHS]
MTDSGGDVATRDATAGALPHIVAEVREDGTGEISVDGVLERIAAADLAEAGAQMTARIAALAQEAGRALPVEVRDPDGLWALLIHPDGRVDEAADADEVAPLTAPVPAGGTPLPVAATGDLAAADTVASGSVPADPAPSGPTPVAATSPEPGASGPTPAVDARSLIHISEPTSLVSR